MTLLMTTEELLAVLEDGSEATTAPAPESKPERRLRVVPPPAAEAPRSAPAAPPGTAPVLWAPTPAAVARPSLAARLYCARHGHDPRPHRPQPHDDVVYRCLRCGRPTPQRQRV
jgi:hypothetical protein